MTIFSRNVAVVFVTLLSSGFSVAQETGYKVQASFELPTADVSLKSEERLFADECLQLSFDESFRADTTAMKAKLRNMLRIPQDTLTVADAPATTFTRIIDWTPSATCTRCHESESILWVQDQNAESYNSWEGNFCKTLRAGAFEVFRNVDHCQIVVRSVESIGSALVLDVLANAANSQNNLTDIPSNNLKFNFNVRASFGLKTDIDMSEEEINFTNEALQESYNEIHEVVGAVIEDAHLRRHFNLPRDVSSSSLMNGNKPKTSNPKRVMDFTYVFAFDVGGICRMCGPGMVGQSGVTEFVTKRSKMEQIRWEAAFCDKLKSGPYKNLRPLNSCYIEIYEED